jgi:23S rRNA pseudouridine2605 synthase
LLLLTNDGRLANKLTHPSYAKIKVYEITLDKPLSPEDAGRVKQGVQLDDGPSKLRIKNHSGKSFKVLMSEGRNRQIRRTFAALGYTVIKLHRSKFGDYELGSLKSGAIQAV